MSLASDPLPTDPDALRQFAASLQAELARKEIEIAANAAEIHAKTLHIEQLKAQLAVLRRARFGRSSEKLDRKIEQLELLIGDLEEDAAEAQARTTNRHARIDANRPAQPRERRHPTRTRLPARIYHARPSHTSRSAPALDVVAACSAASGRTNVRCRNTCPPASRLSGTSGPS
jgi:transposase